MSTRRQFAAVAAAFAMLAPAVARADTWIVEPTPEATDAVTQGADEVANAQKLAKQKMYADAVTILEGVARKYPASAHDCNLALAYMRAGDLTRAQLMLDVASERGGPRPDWCGSSLPAQLTQALRDGEYVPLTVTTTPDDAVIEVAGLTVRRLHLFWLPVANYKVVAHADGYDDAKAPIAVAAPSAEVTLTLSRTKVVTDPVEPVDTDLEGAGDLDAVGDIVQEPPKPLPTKPTPSWPGWAGVVGGGALLAIGAGFHVAALNTKDEANAEFNDTPMYDSLSSTFSRERGLAITSYVIGTAALSFGIWWLTQQAGEHP